MNFSYKDNDLGYFEEVAEMKPKTNQMRLARKLDEKGFHYDTKKPFQSVTEPVRKTSEKLFGESKITSAAIEKVKKF